MTQHDFFMGGYNNVHCRFTFENGAAATGVITSYYFDEPERLDLVQSTDLIKFKKLMDAQDYDSMKRLSQPVRLETIVSAERLN